MSTTFAFKNFTQLTKHFNNELTCALFLEEQRWGGNPLCPHCGSEHYARTKTRLKHPELKDYQDYRCKACDKKYSVLTGTVYESSKISLQVWFQAIYLMAGHKKGISSLQLASDLGVTQKTAWFMLHRIRTSFNGEFAHKMGMNGEVVEADETIVGGKMKNRAKKVRRDIHANDNKSIVMGIVERNGPLYMRLLQNGNMIASTVNEIVDTNAILVTDSSGSYQTDPMKAFQNHHIVKQKKNEFVKGIAYTNSIEGVFSHFDRMVIGTYHYVSRKHMQQYCDEFTFRWNQRSVTDVEKFAMTVKRCEGKRLLYKNLISSVS